MTENIAGTCVCSKCTEFNLRHKVQFHRFLNVLLWTVEDASIGTLRKQDGDGNESVKKAMGLDCEQSLYNGFNEQDKKAARASRFFVHFVAVPAQLRREKTKFLVYLRTGTARR